MRNSVGRFLFLCHSLGLDRCRAMATSGGFPGMRLSVDRLFVNGHDVNVVRIGERVASSSHAGLQTIQNRIDAK